MSHKERTKFKNNRMDAANAHNDMVYNNYRSFFKTMYNDAVMDYAHDAILDARVNRPKITKTTADDVREEMIIQYTIYMWDDDTLSAKQVPVSEFNGHVTAGGMKGKDNYVDANEK